ncbi:helix-turn-helix transcriptional regulator [Actinoplanes sp. CA-131856]
MNQRDELAAFLRSRRERLRPAEVGLPSTGRRRTPGLRREELALLSGISATWYTYLEQGRDVRPSDQVLSALATALRLDGYEREHLFRLAGHEPAPGPAAEERLDPSVAAVPLLLGTCPAYIIGATYDVLSHNPAVLGLLPGLAATGAPPNLARWTFLTPEARDTVADWAVEARALLARVRTLAARHPADTRFNDLIEEFHDGCPEVRRWWRHYEVEPRHSGRKGLRRPDGVVVDYAYAAFHLADQSEQTLVIYSDPRPLTSVS